jgi:hypothetical protein
MFVGKTQSDVEPEYPRLLIVFCLITEGVGMQQKDTVVFTSSLSASVVWWSVCLLLDPRFAGSN